MQLPKDLFPDYDTIIFTDTETSGFDVLKDNIVEIGAIQYQRDFRGEWRRGLEMSELVSLPEGKTMPETASKINHIDDDMLKSDGIAPSEAFADFSGMFDGKNLFVAYNAHFDLNIYMSEFSKRTDGENLHLLQEADVYDAMLTARARAACPTGEKASHRLGDMLFYYGLEDVKNSHRALEDVEALIALTAAFHKERDDLSSSINVFPYYNRHGSPVSFREDPKFVYMNEDEIAKNWSVTKPVVSAQELEMIKAGTIRR